MSRSNYDDELDDQTLHLWRGAVNNAIRGKRGQLLLKDLLIALDAMPEKVLIAEALVNTEGAHCVLGVLGAKRGIDIQSLDPEDSESVSKAFNIADALAREIVYVNDEVGRWDESPQERWERVRAWVVQQVQSPQPATESSQ